MYKQFVNPMEKIIFIGDLNKQTRTFQRYRAFKDLGYKMEKISSVPIGRIPDIGKKPSMIERIFNKLGYPLDITGANKTLIRLAQQWQPDIIWDEKALTLRPKTLKRIRNRFPKVKIVFYSEDDMYAKHNQSVYFVKSIPLFDIIFTTKSYNVKELSSLGAKKVIFVDKTFDVYTHRPISLSKDDYYKFGVDVGFIGTFEKERAEQMLFLAKNGIKIRVFGCGWEDWRGKHPNLQIMGKPVYGDDYIKAICATKINLCFLRKMNRDLQTDRTMEIPACGAFMLAERTEEHQRLFEEGKEAEFFDSKQELLEKIRYYLRHDEEREKIGWAGRKRCVESGYSHHKRLEYMMDQIKRLDP
jgi:spore maturation protein CgeB